MRLISSPTYGIKQGRHQYQITERRHQSSQLEKVYGIKKYVMHPRTQNLPSTNGKTIKLIFSRNKR
jgi:hypothetical protein